MKKQVYLSAILVAVLCAFGAEDVFADQIPLERFMREVGNKYNVYFTLEGSYQGKTYSNMLLAQYVSVQGVPSNIGSAISALTNSITTLAVIPDPGNKLIYHVADKRLLGLSDYAMNKVLEAIKFDGNAGDLVDRIKEKVPNLLNKNVFTDAVAVLNGGTAISIDDKTESVRDALSNGVDLRGYSRILWTSFTSLETEQTQVQFHGTMNASGQ